MVLYFAYNKGFFSIHLEIIIIKDKYNYNTRKEVFKHFNTKRPPSFSLFPILMLIDRRMR